MTKPVDPGRALNDAIIDELRRTSDDPDPERLWLAVQAFQRAIALSRGAVDLSERWWLCPECLNGFEERPSEPWHWADDECQGRCHGVAVAVVQELIATPTRHWLIRVCEHGYRVEHRPKVGRWQHMDADDADFCNGETYVVGVVPRENE